MPIDDSRPARFQRPALAPAVAAKPSQQIADIDNGREPLGIPWEAARQSIFAPPTPKEIAEDEANLSTRMMPAIHQLILDIDAGREKLIPWDAAAERWMFEEDA